jgi:monofunctional biosynthetic peptidoglycan transglycosylase
MRRWVFRLLKLALALVAGLYLFWILSLVALRSVDPPTTGVQIQRRVEAKLNGKAYRKRYKFVSLDLISPNLQHAVIASEDPHFYKHHGIDWEELALVAQQSRETGKLGRGASTITQQLVKNLFFTTHRNPVRKAFEYTLTPLTELILGKRRILELYLNVIEWGPGVYGAAAVSDYYFHTVPAKLDREQSARLAACVPSPLRRKPVWMDQFSVDIMDRMRLLGW